MTKQELIKKYEQIYEDNFNELQGNECEDIDRSEAIVGLAEEILNDLNNLQP